jgi:hypothetical protein
VRRKKNNVIATDIPSFSCVYVNEKSFNIIRNKFPAAAQFPGNISNVQSDAYLANTPSFFVSRFMQSSDSP